LYIRDEDATATAVAAVTATAKIRLRPAFRVQPVRVELAR